MSKISIFPPAKLAKGAHTAQQPPVELMDFLNHIKYGQWKDQVLAYRAEEDKEKKKKLKDMFYGATMSGVFTQRKQDMLLEHSGFICIDIDGFSDKTALQQDPYTFALFYSAGGNGIAVVVKIKGEKHKESFRFLQDYYYRTYGIVVDPAPSNVASLRYVSYDPDLFVNEKAKASLILEEKKPPKKIPVILDKNGFNGVLEQIQTQQINIAESYEDYRNIAFALADEFGEEGRAYFHIVASISRKYTHHHADKQYSHSLKGRKGISIGTFYWLCQQGGVEIKNKFKKEIQVATIAKQNQRDKEYVKKQLVELNKVDPETADTIVDSVYKNDDISAEATAVGPREVLEAMSEFLKQNYPMKKNSITGRIEVNGADLTPDLFNTILIKAKVFFNSREVTRELLESLIYSEFTEKYNPLLDYIEQNKWRTSNGNISRLYYSIESDTPMKDIFVTKWMISIIAALHGHPVRSVLALTGKQNTGKSEFFRRLLPEGLKKYYAESKLDAGKDDELLMCQKLLIMDDEMGGKSKFDEKRFKELTSKHTFSIRAPYARMNEDYRRLAVLCGTSNDDNLISDPTGNTRILPIDVEEIYHDTYNNIDKDELFMEAYRLYIEGAEWQLNKVELAQLKEMSGDFEHIPVERELIREMFRIPNDGEKYEELTSTQMKDIIERRTEQKIYNLTRFGVELKNVFGKRISKNGLRFYRVVVMTY